MNRREIILDFTSLLDVIMIILFFFILFARLETIEEKAAMEEKQADTLSEMKAEYDKLNKEAQDKIKAADEEKKKAKSALEEAEKYLNDLKNSSERAASNIAGIHEFDRGMNLKIHLKMNDNNWKLELFTGDEKISDIPRASLDEMKSAIAAALTEKGCSEKDTILCDFIYNAREDGTASAYKEVRALFDSIKFSYENLYISETDTSIFEEK
ncbi:MAG: biopolymer transporter ExbD [Oscillospiraceae bacterium]|nr:biopolymer transporter ExbD [Oscillospiraceae bacterium]